MAKKAAPKKTAPKKTVKRIGQFVTAGAHPGGGARTRRTPVPAGAHPGGLRKRAKPVAAGAHPGVPHTLTFDPPKLVKKVELIHSGGKLKLKVHES